MKEYLKLYRVRNLGNGATVIHEDVEIHVDDNVYYPLQTSAPYTTGDTFFIGVNFQKYNDVVWSKMFGYFHVVPKPVVFKRQKVWQT
jgi:hypothetical protein